VSDEATKRHRRFRLLRLPSAFALFWVSFFFLACAAGAVAWGQFTRSVHQGHLAPWVSMMLSGAAVLSAATSLATRRRR
jgi:hypothetical protein